MTTIWISPTCAVIILGIGIFLFVTGLVLSWRNHYREWCASDGVQIIRDDGCPCFFCGRSAVEFDPGRMVWVCERHQLVVQEIAEEEEDADAVMEW